MRVAIYARVSTEDQHNENQVRMCCEYCERNGHEITRVYTDTISGMKSSRPGFDALLADMRLMHFNCIVVSKLDRVGRSLQNILALFDEFTSKGVHFIAVSQNIDTSSAAGKFQLQVLGAFAEFERNIISERTREGLVGKKNVGKRGPDKKPRQKRGVLRPRIKMVEKQHG
jgi:DNA invertase Pin-like site-specific DNA recombinase